MLEISSLNTCALKTTSIWVTVPEIWSETEFLFHFGPFFALLPNPPSPNNLGNQNFEKMEVASGDGIISHMCTKNYNHMMYASWDMDVICHFGSFFALLPHYWPQKLKPGKNIKKPWRYYPFTRKWKVNEDERCMVREIKGRSDRVLLFWAIFYPPDNPKNQNFEKTTQIPQDIILHLCTTNDNYMMYGSWDMECNRQNFLSFWTIFYHFAPLTTCKIKIFWKNEKKTWIYYHFTHVYHKWKTYDASLKNTPCWITTQFHRDS